MESFPIRGVPKYRKHFSSPRRLGVENLAIFVVILKLTTFSVDVTLFAVFYLFHEMQARNKTELPGVPPTLKF